MKKAQILILSVMLAFGLIGCRKEKNLETTELIESGNEEKLETIEGTGSGNEELETTEVSEEKTEENMEHGSGIVFGFRLYDSR